MDYRQFRTKSLIALAAFTLTVLFMAFTAFSLSSCSGGGGGGSSSSSSGIEGIWIHDEAEVAGGSGATCYTGLYLTGGKAYPAMSKDKSTIYYVTDNSTRFPIGSYTVSGNTVTINQDNEVSVCTLNGDTLTYQENGKTRIARKNTSAKIQEVSTATLVGLVLSWR